jgi:hypothetical protein
MAKLPISVDFVSTQDDEWVLNTFDVVYPFEDIFKCIVSLINIDLLETSKTTKTIEDDLT